MAEKILKGINFPGLEDTYMVPEVDNTLTVSGASADAKVTGDAISNLNTLVGDTSVSEQINSVADELSAEIDTKIGYYIIDILYTNNGDEETYTHVNFIWNDLIAAIDANKYIVCRVYDEDRLQHTYFTFTYCDEEEEVAYFSELGDASISTLFLYTNGFIGKTNQRFLIDDTLTTSGAPADAKAVGDAIANASVVATDANGDGNIVFNSYIVSEISSAEGVSF